MFKFHSNISSEMLGNILEFDLNHNSFKRHPTYSLYNGTEALSYLGQKTCSLFPNKKNRFT